MGSTSSIPFSKGGYLGNAKAISVIKDVKVSMIVEVNVEYLLNAKTATKAKDHNKIRKNSPRPMPKTLGPSSAATKLSASLFKEDILFTTHRYSKRAAFNFINKIDILALFNWFRLVTINDVRRKKKSAEHKSNRTESEET